MRFGESDELEGVDYIRFTGSISTLDGEDEYDVPEREFEFGFRAPLLGDPVWVGDLPHLSSFAWSRWLP